MALLADFTGTNGDPIPAGLTAYDGTGEIQSNRLAGVSVSGSGTHFLNSDVANSFIECIVNLGGLAANRNGVTFRFSTLTAHFRLTISGAGLVELSKVNGSATLLDSYSIAGFSTSTDYIVRAEFTGTSLVGKIDGVTRVSATDAFNQTEILHGIRAGNTTARFDDLNVGTVAPSTGIDIGEAPFANIVYQRNSSNVSPVVFPITYDGTPAALQYRLLDAADDSTEITTWTTFDASPTDGTSSLSFNAPTSAATAYHVEVRHSDDTDVTDLQTVDWRAGANIFIIGQSTSEDLTTDGAITAEAGHYFWNGSAGVVPTVGTGAAEMANALIGADDISVMIASASVGSTALTVEAGFPDYWNNTGGTLWTDALAVVDAITDESNKLEYICWYQGSKDAIANVSTVDYQAGLVTFLTTVQAAFTDGDGGNVPFLSAVVGRDTRGTGATNTNLQAIKTAQLNHAPTDANVYLLDAYTFESEDGIHLTDAGLADFGSQYAAIYSYAKGDTAIDAPVVSSVVAGDTTSEIDIVYDSALLTSDTTYSTEGVRVELDGSPLTVSGFARKNSTTVTITLSAPLTAGVVTVYTGYGTGATQLELTYPRSSDAVLPNTGGTFNIIAIPANGNVMMEAGEASGSSSMMQFVMMGVFR